MQPTKLQTALSKLEQAVNAANLAAFNAPVLQYRILTPMSREFIYGPYRSTARA